MLTDIAGADNPVSGAIRKVEGLLQQLLSAQAKADQQEVSRIMAKAEDMGAGPQFRAAVKAFMVSPADFVSQGLGTLIPGALATAVAGVPGVLLYGTGSGVGLIKGAIFDAVNETLIEQGSTPEEARQTAIEAQSYAGDNLDMIATGGLFGYASTRFGAQPAIAQAIQKKIGDRLVKEGVEPAVQETLKRGVLSNLGRTAVTEAVPEAAQAAQEQFAQNLALRRQDIDVPLMRGVVGSAALEGGIGAIIGGGVGTIEAQQADTKLAERRAAAKLQEPLEAEKVGVETDDSRRRLPQEEEFKDFGLPETEEVGTSGIAVDTDTLAQALRESREEEGRVGVEPVVTADEEKRVEEVDPFGEDELAPEVEEAARAAEEEAEIDSILRQEREAQTLTEAQTAEEGVEAEPVVTAEEVVESVVTAEEVVEPVVTAEEEVEPVVTAEEGVDVEPVVTAEEEVEAEPVVTAEEEVEPVVTTEEEVEAAPTIDPVQTPELAEELASGRKILSLSPEGKAEREAKEKTALKLAPTQAYVQPPVNLETERKKIADKERNGRTRTVSGLVNTIKNGVSNILRKKEHVSFFPSQESFTSYGQNPEEQMANEVAQATEANIAAGMAPEVAAETAQKTADKKRKVFKKIEAEKTKLQNTRLDQLYDVMVIATDPKLEGTKIQAAAVEALKTEGVTEAEVKDAAVRAENTLVELARLGAIPVQKPVAPQVSTKPKPEVVDGTEIDLGMQELEQAQAQTQAVKKSDDLVSRTRLAGPVLETNTAGEAALLIADNKTLTVFERMLARTLRRFLEKTKTKFVIVTDANTLPERLKNIFVNTEGATVTAGVYDPQTNTIYLDAKEGADSGTALHEMVHAVTLDMIYSYIKDRDSLPPKAQAALDVILDLMYNAQEHYAMLVETGRNTPELDLYAKSTDNFTDLAEFVAYGITGAELQRMLMAMPPVAKGALARIRSAFSNFVDALADMLGIPNLQYNAFAQLIDLTGVVAEETMKGTPFKASEVVQAKNKREKISSLRKKKNLNTSIEQVLTTQKSIWELTRNPKEAVKKFLEVADYVTGAAQRGMLRVLPTELINEIAKIKGLNVAQRLADTQEQVIVYRNEKIKEIGALIGKWENFVLNNPDMVDSFSDFFRLGSSENILIYDTASKTFVTLETSLDKDSEVKDLEFTLAEIKKIPEKNLTSENKTARTKAQKALESRTDSIREMFAIVESVRAKPNGREALDIYAKAQDRYRADVVESIELLKTGVREDPNIAGTEVDIATDKGLLLSQIDAMYVEMLQMKNYSPQLRPGKFWVEAFDSKGTRIFVKDLESDYQREKYMKAYAAFDPTMRLERRNPEDSDKTMQKLLQGDGVKLTELFTNLDRVAAQDVTALAEVKDAIYQLYLTALPSGAARKKVMHRKDIPGFDQDPLKAFAINQSMVVNQLSRLKYGAKLRNQIAEGKGSIKAPFDAPEQRLKESLISVLAERVNFGISPPVMGSMEEKADALSRAATKMTFIYMLTAARSALIQPTQLIVFGFGGLHAKFGAGKTAAMATKYMKNFLTAEALSRVKLDKDGQVLNEKGEPAMRNSRYIKESPIKDALQKAWDFGDLRNSFSDTYTRSLTGVTEDVESKLRTSGAGNRPTVGRVYNQFMEMVSTPIHLSEKVSREVFFLSAFELEYERRQKAGETGDAAINSAAEIAEKLTKSLMFDYGARNKPVFAQTWYGRMGYQFMTYQIQAIAHLTVNFYKAYAASGLTKAEKKESAIMFWDTVALNALLSGVTGVLGYTAIIGIIDGLREALRPDVDDEDADQYYDMDDSGNPIGLRSFDLYIRNEFLDKYFGPKSSLAASLGLEPETAQTMQRSVEFGLISGLTDWNWQASLELNGIIYKDFGEKDLSSEDKAVNFVFDRALGPFASVIRNVSKGTEKMAEGDIALGLEMLLPAFLKQPMKAMRFASEGNITPGENVLKPAEYYTYWKLTGQALGFGSTEVAESQVATYKLKEVNDAIKKERNEVFEAFEESMRNQKAVADKHGVGSKRVLVANNQVKEVLDDVRAYNYKNFFYPIEVKDLSASLRERLRRSGLTFEGYFAGDDLSALTMRIIMPSRSVQNPPEETE